MTRNLMTPPASQPTAAGNATPHQLIGFATLAKMVFDGQDLAPLGQRLLARIAQYPDDANAMLDASFILQILGQHDLAMSLQRDAVNLQRIFHIPASRQPAALRLLVICTPGDLMANTPVENLLVDSDVDISYLFLTMDQPPPDLVPEHDLLFIAPAECDANRPLLEFLDYLAPNWPRPVVNRPACIIELARDRASMLLAGIPGVVMPDFARINRAKLEALAHNRLPLGNLLPGAEFPIIARPIDSHAGHGLQKLNNSAAVAGYLAAMPDPEFSIAPFIDYRSADGQFRKYRIALIDGRPFACHMAISSHWMVHYLNAGMTESAEKRAEEARFMENFDQDFAVRHQAAFAAITERLGLDYYGLDCAETPDGGLLVFEPDTAMIVHAMDPVDMFPYKQPQMRKVFAAFRQMLLDAARQAD